MSSTTGPHPDADPPSAGEPDPATGRDTPVRRRTRRAIIDAAVHVWARDFAAPLSTVAQEAAVSRSTLHRYFPDRPALLDACLRTAMEVLGEADPCDDAGGATGGAPEQPALDRLMSQLEGVVQLGDWVLFLWTDPSRFAGHPLAGELVGGGEDDVTLALIRRGQQEGSLDPDVPADWLLSVYYSVLYCAAELAVRGALPAHEAGRLGVRALRSGIAPS
jgi:AcrR family transcriptional regulator